MKLRREAGNTLIELLAATVILGVISFALTEAVVSGFRNTGDTEDRLVGSLDRQKVAAAFVPDVQSADPFSPQTAACGDDPGLDGLKLGWTDGITKMLSTYLEVVNGSQSELVRRYCEDGNVRDESTLAEYSGVFRYSCAEAPLDPNQCSVTVPGKPRPFVVVAERRAS